MVEFGEWCSLSGKKIESMGMEGSHTLSFLTEDGLKVKIAATAYPLINADGRIEARPTLELVITKKC
jgi:hypothetical protein